MKVPRAEEIIAKVYASCCEIRQRGNTPQFITMPSAYWKAVDDYRKRLGPLEGTLPDYLADDGLFGLEAWITEEEHITVWDEETQGKSLGEQI
ncbi:MAG: hypothetical protein MI717_12655 [Spirochaetales bacterium]|nr:hypothetical protein [Spirochaetales bacterium]